MTLFRDDSRLTSTRRLLLAAADSDPSTFAALVRAGVDRFDWEWLLECAASHKIVAMVAARLDEHHIPAELPAAIQSQLHDVRRRSAERARLARVTLLGAAEALTRAGVPFLVIKGNVFAERLYSSPALRPFYDVDLVVRASQMAGAERALKDLGYLFKPVRGSWLRLHGIPFDEDENGCAPEDLSRRFLMEYHHHLAFAAPSGLLPVEVHWQLAPPGLLRVTERDLWKETQPVMVAGLQVNTLGPEATVVHAAFHATQDELSAFRLLHLCDFVRLLTVQPDLDVARVCCLAETWGAAGELASALHASKRLLGFHGAKALELRLRRGPSTRLAFALLGSHRELIDKHTPKRVSARLVRNMARQIIWDTAKGRPARAVIRRVWIGIRRQFPPGSAKFRRDVAARQASSGRP